MPNDTPERMPSTSPLPTLEPTVLSMVGGLAQEIAEAIEGHYGPEARVTCAAIVVEVHAPDGQGGLVDDIEYMASDPRRWVQYALLGEALSIAEARNEDRAEEAAQLGMPPDDD